MRNPLQTLARHVNNLQNVVWNSRALFDDPVVWLPSAMEYLVYIGGMYDELVPRIVSAYASKPGLRDSVLWSMASAVYEAQETVYGGTAFGGLRVLGLTPTVDRPVPDTTPTAEQLRAAERAAEGAVERVRAGSGRTPTGASRATAQTIIEEIKRQYPDAFSTIGVTVDAELVKSGANEVKAALAETKAMVNEVAAARRTATGSFGSEIVDLITGNKAGPMVQGLAGKATGLALTATVLLITLAVGKRIMWGSWEDEANKIAREAEARAHEALLSGCAPGDAVCVANENLRYAAAVRAGTECSMLSTPYGTVLGGLAGIALGWAGIRKLKNL